MVKCSVNGQLFNRRIAGGNEVTYSAPGSTMVRLEISDLTGKTVYVTSVRSGIQGTNTVMIDNSFITPGIRIIWLYSAHHGMVSKSFTIFR